VVKLLNLTAKAQRCREKTRKKSSAVLCGETAEFSRKGAKTQREKNKKKKLCGALW
jgi:hypothetical protein